MKTSLHWKKGIFKSSYEIFSGDLPIGNLRPDTWSSNGQGELNGKKYTFEAKGFFNLETLISTPGSNMPIGKITYNSWKTKAIIEYGNKTFNWKYENLWNTKWSISDSDGILMRFSGSLTKGVIELEVQDELLILSGLYITNYFWQISSVVIT
jgi:hypothetical protein